MYTSDYIDKEIQTIKYNLNSLRTEGLINFSTIEIVQDKKNIYVLIKCTNNRDATQIKNKKMQIETEHIQFYEIFDKQNFSIVNFKFDNVNNTKIHEKYDRTYSMYR